MKCRVLFEPNTQVVKWRLHWRSPELLATDTEGTCSFTCMEIFDQTHTKAFLSEALTYLPNLCCVVGTSATVFEIN
jgi:hypothetical protein